MEDLPRQRFEPLIHALRQSEEGPAVLTMLLDSLPRRRSGRGG